MSKPSLGKFGVKRLVAIGFGASCMALAGGASAQESGWGAEGPSTRLGPYLEAGPTFHQFEGDNGVNADTWAITARAGWQFMPMFSVEADASFGVDDKDFDYQTSEGDISTDDNSDGDVADIISAPGEFGLNYMLGIYGKVSYPVTPQFDVFARAGYAHADIDTTVTTPGGTSITLDDAEGGGSYGAGASWHLSENSAIRVDYTYTDFDLAEDNAYGVSYQFKF